MDGLVPNADPTTTTPYHRVEGLWFDDGSIIVRAGSKEFRLYRGTLAAKSPVFSDMACFPSPQDRDAENGVAVVCLPDSPDEVEAFLRALFDAEYLEPYPADLHMSIHQLLGIARLSHKYDVRYLRRRAMSHLNEIFPPSFDKYKPYRDQENPQFSIYDDKVLLTAIPVFREIEAPWLLPIALHCAGAVDGQALLSSDLSNMDKENVFRGHAHHLARLSDILPGLHADAAPDCPSLTTCTPEWTRWQANYVHFARGVARSVADRDNNACAAYNILDFTRRVEGGFCVTCNDCRWERLSSSMKEFWDDLPRSFRLDSWNALLDLRDEYDMNHQ